jgi:hypothetical protein
MDPAVITICYLFCGLLVALAVLQKAYAKHDEPKRFSDFAPIAGDFLVLAALWPLALIVCGVSGLGRAVWFCTKPR